ncbi:hypothetical protein DERF_003275 [Dermatophagoides farinae]|uniref:Transmembrane protein n=1 Tax=Dermatophagoides farinae TaxID=6954 RepID=A0A922LBD7_DERFA|nr:hypothetical protein DERF_003275 [Dermatophagoides farinae]
MAKFKGTLQFFTFKSILARSRRNQDKKKEREQDDDSGDEFIVIDKLDRSVGWSNVDGVLIFASFFNCGSLIILHLIKMMMMMNPDQDSP